MPTDHATTESRPTSWQLNRHHPNTTSRHGYWNLFVSSMQPATAGSHDAQRFAGGPKKMSSVFVIATQMMLVAFMLVLLIFISNDDNDGGHA
jgi:hypothetical protein